MVADLHKKTQVSPFKSIFGRLEAFLERHAFFFLCVCMVILFLLVTMLIMVVFGASVTGTEANAYYNHLGDII